MYMFQNKSHIFQRNNAIIHIFNKEFSTNEPKTKTRIDKFSVYDCSTRGPSSVHSTYIACHLHSCQER